MKYASIQTPEKIPRQIEADGDRDFRPRLGSSRHQSHRPPGERGRCGGVLEGRPPDQRNHRRVFQAPGRHLVAGGSEAVSGALSLDPKVVSAAYDYFMEHEPRHASMLRSSISPNIFQAGYRVNVIPSEAKATLDVRLLPGEDADKFLEQVQESDQRPGHRGAVCGSQPAADARRQDRYRGVSRARRRGQASLQHGHAADDGHGCDRHRRICARRACSATASVRRPTSEDGPLGFGAHSDQERILESELFRFVRFNWDVVMELAAVR